MGGIPAAEALSRQLVKLLFFLEH